MRLVIEFLCVNASKFTVYRTSDDGLFAFPPVTVDDMLFVRSKWISRSPRPSLQFPNDSFRGSDHTLHNFSFGFCAPTVCPSIVLRKKNRKLSRRKSPLTMSEGTAHEPPFFDHALEDATSPEYQFDTTEWVDPPMLVFDDDNPDNKEIVCRRNANDSVYRNHFSTPERWQRYVTLGYYALDDGALFDMAWLGMESHSLRLHRMIWYKYMYHVDWHLDIPPKLDVWAINITQPYLQAVDPDALLMDTTLLPWKKLILYMKKNKTVSGDWKLVGSRNHRKWQRVNPSHPPLQRLRVAESLLVFLFQGFISLPKNIRKPSPQVPRNGRLFKSRILPKLIPSSSLQHLRLSQVFQTSEGAKCSIDHNLLSYLLYLSQTL